MKAPEWIMRLFQTIDKKDAEHFADFLASDATFAFGNQEPVTGKEVIRSAVTGFFASIEGTSHKVVGTWVHPDSVIIRGTVTYTRKDKSTLTVPFANIFAMEGSLIKDYRIYIDTSKLYI